MKWAYVLTIDHLDLNSFYEDGSPVIRYTETFRSRTLEGIQKQFEKHNYSGYVENLNCRYRINGRSFTYDKSEGILFFSERFYFD